LKPLFTSGSGQKRTQGKSLWNLEGMKLLVSNVMLTIKQRLS
jgi:hypothetical protein